MSRIRPILALAIAAFAIASCTAAEPLHGTVRGTDGEPLAGVFLAVLGGGFGVQSYTVSGADGTFSLDRDFMAKYLFVRPPGNPAGETLEVPAYQPRIYVLDDTATIELRLPAVGSIVVRAFSADGALMRYEDFEKQGTFAGQYAYVTNLDDQMIPAVLGPAHDAVSRKQNSPREQGWPAFFLEPGQRVAVQALFWNVPGYGKLWLRADNAGEGFAVPAAGKALVVDVNVEFARTALAGTAGRGFRNRQDELAVLQGRLDGLATIADPARRASEADRILADALRQRDDLEYQAALAAIPDVRQGALELDIVDGQGIPLPNTAIEYAQLSHEFLFGVFEGSPYNATAFTLAREAGFDMATVLLGWNWTEPKDGDWKPIDEVFGITPLDDLGYTVKAHGALWLQQYGIMPDRAMTMEHGALRDAALDHYRRLVRQFADTVDVWEVMNEPATTNLVGMPRDMVMAMIADAAAILKEEDPEAPTLVNNPHELSFGGKYMFFGMDNAPLDDYPQTYSRFLQEASQAGALRNVDIVGLQFYPGPHLSDMFGGLEGPAVTPSWLVDTVDRYARLTGKPVHITEFSLPSSYEKGWNAGYWREPWTEEIQARYADYIYTMMFAHPDVHSITWWDVMGTKPSVVTGGLTDKGGRKKPVFDTIQAHVKAWTTTGTTATDASGKARIKGFGGAYNVSVRLPDGTLHKRVIDVRERETTHVVMDVESDGK